MTYLRTHLSTNGVENDLRRVMSNIAKSVRYIALEVKKFNRGSAGSQNLFGETQLKIDRLADKIILERLSDETSFGIDQFASEEQDEIIHFDSGNGDLERKYSVTVDPLDGSSLVDVNLSIGTIVAVHKGKILSGKSGRENLVASMFFLYGPGTTMIYSAGNGVHEFILDVAGNWILKQENIVMKEKGNLYSPGGLRKDWGDNHKNFIEDLEEQGYKLRYSGALVADVNQLILKRGGLFSYPALNEVPDGKLRLLMELQPFSFIVENAGGAATDGLVNILDKVPTKLDERSPIYIGSKYEVELAKKYLNED
ncbi:fructose-1,6-bisphosphatase [Candidatus Woesearchaeota archaeon]|jgi:fructose-1,6-bisphosphatase I|nr:fructose-1,6-bisphosphatase [Candidatus Woesearchaeota archaeon]MBT6519579.1 fructose-1,6-bisphosphatase [Candidatus Woesearchaeota archaeon]MBT7367676.1 fructose-1,6-bisphosphatase [Candidatus Woesearchaeota archaeon]